MPEQDLACLSLLSILIVDKSQIINLINIIRICIERHYCKVYLNILSGNWVDIFDVKGLIQNLIVICRHKQLMHDLDISML